MKLSPCVGLECGALWVRIGIANGAGQTAGFLVGVTQAGTEVVSEGEQGAPVLGRVELVAANALTMFTLDADSELTEHQARVLCAGLKTIEHVASAYGTVSWPPRTRRSRWSWRR